MIAGNDGQGARDAAARHVAIVGGGFSGAVLARALARAGVARITVVEPRRELGGGVAYSSPESGHLINGPARMCSLDPERPDAFSAWAERHGGAADLHRGGDDLFTSRRLYGAFVRAELDAALAGSRSAFRHVRASAVALEGGEEVRIVLDDGEVIRADHVVLATGITRGRPAFETEALRASGRYLGDPWRQDGYAGLAARSAGLGRVVLAGSGLTALDALVSLERAGFAGQVEVISRRGLLAQVRRPAAAWPDGADLLPPGGRVGALVRRIRQARLAIRAAGEDWQRLSPALVPQTQALWREATDAARLGYLRHLRPFWETARHRAAPPTAALAEAWREAGRLHTRAARILAVEVGGDGRLEIVVRGRGRTTPERIAADGLINCIGAELSLARAAEADPLLADPLLADPLLAGLLLAGLLASGRARPGPIGLGLDADGSGALIGRDGRPSATLSGLGPILRGAFWESNSVPEILAQVGGLVGRLAQTEAAYA